MQQYIDRHFGVYIIYRGNCASCFHYRADLILRLTPFKYTLCQRREEIFVDFFSVSECVVCFLGMSFAVVILDCQL
jgi:hypothetical protein